MIDNRWFPPSPHKEAVLEFLKKGRAHIEERGHNNPPLLVFEDGGVMELPVARFKDGNFSPAQGITVTRQTNYSDVCGTIDELKKLLKERPEMAQENPARFFELIDDLCYMLSRMQVRQDKYQKFADSVMSVAQRLKEITGPDIGYAYKKADEIRNFLRSEPVRVSEELNKLYDMAEEVRDVANRMEKEVLYAYRDLAKELGRLYEEIRGSRKWD